VPYNTCSVNCHRAEVTFQPLPQPIAADTRFRMQGWVELVVLFTYRDGIPARRRSTIPVLTRLNVEQVRSCDERRYHNAKLPTNTHRLDHAACDICSNIPHLALLAVLAMRPKMTTVFGVVLKDKTTYDTRVSFSYTEDLFKARRIQRHASSLDSKTTPTVRW